MRRHRKEALRWTAVLFVAWACVPGVTGEVPSPAGLALKHFRSLAGTWEGKSTKGWDNEMSARVIAKESVVVMSDFDSHPGEAMLTTVHLDGKDLLLTHYCIAGNQPRMVASKISEDGREITFQFRDATNLPSRDHGHMDKAVAELETASRVPTEVVLVAEIACRRIVAREGLIPRQW